MEPVKDAILAVVGGRKFSDYKYMKNYLNKYREKHGISHIVSGGAKGADTLAEHYAREYEISYTIFLPKWNALGIKAPFERNDAIAEMCTAMMAFPDPDSRGTYHSIEMARQRNKPYWVFKYWE